MSAFVAEVTARVHQLDEVAPVDRIIFGRANPFAIAKRDEMALTSALVADYVRWHRDHNVGFGRFVGRFEPADGDDLVASVPVFPIDLFKQLDLASVPNAEVVRRFRSSGTSGTVSVVPRDDVTLARFAGSMRVGLRLLEPWLSTDELDINVEVVSLTASPQEAGDIWFSYAMALGRAFASSEFLVQGGVFLAEAAADAIARHLANGALVGVVGPPALLMDLLTWMGANGRRVRGRDRIVVLTGGGWKRRIGEAVEPDELRREAARVLGLDSLEQVRDCFSQVELNSVFVECAQHRKHVPPWVHALARSPATLAPVAPGTMGLLAYIDTSARSYPCCIISDDFGAIDPEPCPCGATGTTLRITRRVARSTGSEGCALKIQHALQGPEEVDG
ncbi:MAG TPA: hypothetical protein VG346_11925 [Acidimicrobiales bacterium]|jgi:long-chain-fatty-acid---luciferin-component ligase|nr:hypothetical protein [Acidimicrobiales bacterium]